ncbi:hypothetical protein J6590_060115 [Homalodisca vitripennis]|nr:hypothetical protein J6590_060113 [Homalodisca vitripennis]KAG8316021.1 hypothetical protein J6590_060115 [Homalodisca vitripennis]
MAPTNKNPNCGDSLKKATDNSGGILCEGICNKWFHFECAGKSKSEYSYSTGEKSNFLCENCEPQLDKRDCVTMKKPFLVGWRKQISVKEIFSILDNVSDSDRSSEQSEHNTDTEQSGDEDVNVILQNYYDAVIPGPSQQRKRPSPNVSCVYT